MREINFRGKTGEGEWVYGDLFRGVDGDSYIHIVEDYGQNVEVQPETICQYTGLKDVTGKEVYEGDVIRVKEYRNELMDDVHEDSDFDLFSLEEIMGNKMKEFVSPVTWENGVFAIYDEEDSGYFFCVLTGDMKRSQPIFITEVIGNIHDNPELL